MTSHTVEIEASGPLRGRIAVPGDKSISHRAFLINALAPGSARLTGVLDSDDVRCSRELVRALGVAVTPDDGGYRIDVPEQLCEPSEVIDCGNSGTTMRLGAGIVAQIDGLTVLTGDHSLRRRPMGRVVEPLVTMGARLDGRQGARVAPLVVRGGDLHAVSHDLSVASAQVKSAILLGGRRCGARVREPRRSRDHTERFLRAMGAAVREEPDGELVLEPSDWHAVDVRVPGDISSAAFWLVAASVLPGSELELPSVGLNPTRTGVLDVLRQMGAEISISGQADEVEPQGTLTVKTAPLHGIRIAGELALRSLDELPVLAVAAVMAQGETIIADAAELRVKESDRIARIAMGLREMGAEIEERPDGMVIAGGGFHGRSRATLDANGDHRLAMAFTVAGLLAPRGVRVLHAEAVRTSYPSFFAELRRVQR